MGFFTTGVFGSLGFLSTNMDLSLNGWPLELNIGACGPSWVYRGGASVEAGVAVSV